MSRRHKIERVWAREPAPVCHTLFWQPECSPLLLPCKTILVSCSSLPWWDTWEYIAAIAKGESPLSPSWLWRQHNEQRLVIQKLFFVVDLKMFHARQIFLLASIVTIQLLHLGLWGWNMRVMGSVSKRMCCNFPGWRLRSEIE
jgi:hypothetical protein